MGLGNSVESHAARGDLPGKKEPTERKKKGLDRAYVAQWLSAQRNQPVSPNLTYSAVNSLDGLGKLLSYVFIVTETMYVKHFEYCV